MINLFIEGQKVMNKAAKVDQRPKRYKAK